MDFFQICTKEAKGGVIEIYPDFTVGRAKDLMVRGKAFYAIWDPEKNLWSTDEYDVQRIVDDALFRYSEDLKKTGVACNVKYLRSFGSNGWTQFQKFLKNVSDNSHQLDTTLTFADTPVKKTDYVSRRLPYNLAPGEYSAWDELIGTLYSEEERAKIEWAIGAVITGDSKKLQKFLVFYGRAGSGKGTALSIIKKLFDGYTTTFDAKSLVGNNNAFATEAFRYNPLVAIQYDGDLSKIEDNTKLNMLVAHEDMTMNEKYKSTYTSHTDTFLFMGTNKPVKITDAKSGIIRRLIDVHPTGVTIPVKRYYTLFAQVDFELGAIAHHCLEVYRKMGKNYYNNYRPLEMMLQTDVFFNFIEAYYDVFKKQDGVSLRQAYTLYKEYCSDTGIEHVLPQYKVREELRNYFEMFHDRIVIDGVPVRSYYLGFEARPFKTPLKKNGPPFSLVLDETDSIFDREFADQPAQYANSKGNPAKYWDDKPRMIEGKLTTPRESQIVDTVLKDLDTTKIHFVKIPENHIVIDFDLKDESGGKSLERNLEAASQWPATYAEYSKSGKGIHLHYTYGGDVSFLDSNYSEGIEVKIFRGNGSLRRKLSRCNAIGIATINSGLPFKEKKVLDSTVVKSEKGLRDLIGRNLRKDIHPGTKPSIDFIKKILDDAYASGMIYDVMDLRPMIVAFANNSTNQSLLCLKTVQTMKFQSEAKALPAEEDKSANNDVIVFFDVEVYPNLFVVCWKYRGDSNVVSMINPSPQEVEKLFGFKLIGFNNRRYDNHILYARYMGYDNQALFELSQKIVSGNIGAMFGGAYDISYTDVYDFSSKKESLKKFEIELGIHHLELDLPWDQPVPEEEWDRVIKYCSNDVIATEAVFNARQQDFVARQILAELSGLTVNDTTQKHTGRIIFGDDRNPQRTFIYTKLETEFPGYVYERGKSTYRDEVTGEGGYVYAEPGMYENIALLDVASMHPTSIIRLNLFGDYTRNFAELVETRLAIKHGNYDKARHLLGGKLEKFLSNIESSKALSDALKIVINIVYGLTSAKFDNLFRDPRNVDNIVAKRGALFMIDLKHAVEEQGFRAAHIKTDSIKIPNATPDIIKFVIEFGAKYGYTFEHEATYDRLCLVNDAVYIAREPECVEGICWTAVGAQFQHPYVFKTLFSHEIIDFDDLCETKQVVQGAMHLDFDLLKPMFEYQRSHFVGRTGRFVPVTKDSGGGILLRIKDGKSYAVTGTKGYFWLEAEVARSLGDKIEIDMSYFNRLVDEARDTIDYFGSFHDFVS